MAADSTLVNAAFKLGSARAGADNPNMKPLTDANTDISKGFMGVAQGAMNNYAKVKKIERAGLARQTQVFDNKVNSIIESIYEQEEPMHNGFIELYRGQIELLQEQFESNNKFGKNDTVESNRERARIMGELSRIKNAAVGFRGKLGAFVEGQRVGGNKSEFNAANMDANNQALDFKNYDELIEKGLIKLDYGKNGVEIISIIGDTEFVVTLDSLKKDFPLTNLEHHGAHLAAITQTKGKATADANSVGVTSTYNEQEQIIAYTRSVDTPDNFQNLVSSQVDGVHMESTFKQSLETNLDVSEAVLDNMFVDGENVGIKYQAVLDLDKDGDVDSDDLLKGGSLKGNEGELFKQNVDALIDVITNIDNPAFNIQYSSELLGKHLAAHDKKEYNDTFAKAKSANEDKKKSKSGNYTVLGREMTAETFETSYRETVQFIEEPREGQTRSGNGYNFKYINGQHYREDDKEEYTIAVSPSSVAKYTGLTNYTTTPDDSLDSVDFEVSNKETETETGVPLISSRGWTSKNFDDQAAQMEILDDIRTTYKDYPNFTFEAYGGQLLVTSPNGEKKYVDMDRKFGGNTVASKELQTFIALHAKTEETLKGLSQKEIEESVAKGEESKFNVGPDGELLSEGYTMNDLGKVVWVGVGTEPTKK